MNLSVFSAFERDGFAVVLCSIHYGELFDVLGIVRHTSTGQLTHRIFPYEPGYKNAQRATEWVQILLNLEDWTDVLRSPEVAHAG